MEAYCVEVRKAEAVAASASAAAATDTSCAEAAEDIYIEAAYCYSITSVSSQS